MKANVGDHLVVESKSAEQHRVEGEIIEVHGESGDAAVPGAVARRARGVAVPGARRARASA